ncbi:MAG: hypothetical protein FLDDKLPJ_03587 [Phycisphaerae bacterium]|nr:hypothetical protein [Phycisphaerae bacterium]
MNRSAAFPAGPDSEAIDGFRFGFFQMSDHRTGESTSPSLLRRVRDPSDAGSWREFTDRYGDLVYGYSLKCGLQPADCDDVRQIVWTNLATGLRNFEYDPARGRFRHYLGRVTKNAITRFVSRKGAPVGALDTGVLAAVAEDAGECDAFWEQEWVNHHYRLAMRAIEDSFEGRSVEAFKRLLAGDATDIVATDFGLSVPAVHQLKHRIKERMRELIEAQVREEDEPYAAGS